MNEMTSSHLHERCASMSVALGLQALSRVFSVLPKGKGAWSPKGELGEGCLRLAGDTGAMQGRAGRTSLSS